MVDERFIIHRFKATRFATVVGVVMMFGYFNYNLFAKKVYRWDLLIIMASMALSKLIAMYYFRKTN